MAHPTGESKDGVHKLDFDRRLMLQFRGSVVTSDAGLLAYRELDDALGLSAIAGETLADARTGKNGRHALVGLLRQSVFGRLAGYDDVNDAERLRHERHDRPRPCATGTRTRNNQVVTRPYAQLIVGVLTRSFKCSECAMRCAPCSPCLPGPAHCNLFGVPGKCVTS